MKKLKNKTINYITEMTQLLKENNNINELNIQFIIYNNFIPYINFKNDYNDLLIQLSTHIDSLELYEYKKEIWLSNNITNKTYYELNDNEIILNWDNENLNGFVIKILSSSNNNSYNFDWLDIQEYYNKSYVNNNSLKNIELNVNLIRYDYNNNGGYININNIDIIINYTQNSPSGSLYLKNDNISLLDGDLLTIGNHWVYNCYPLSDSILFNRFNFLDKEIITNELKSSNVFYNNQSSINTFLTFENNDNYEINLDIEEIHGFGLTNTIELKNTKILYPSQNFSSNYEIKAITFWMKEWKSNYLFKYNNISIVRDLPNDINQYIIKNNDGIILSPITNDNKDKINIYNNGDWTFIYIELYEPITHFNKNIIEINSNDGSIKIAELNFYKYKLSQEQINYISKNALINYKITYDNKTIITSGIKYILYKKEY